MNPAAISADVRQTSADRMVRVLARLAVQPGDHVLEIGCGAGIAVALVCDRLATGTVTAIDQSPKMIALARKRNAKWVTAGRATFLTGALGDTAFGAARFDKVFALRVGVFFRGQPARELQVIARHLAPGGSLYLFYDTPAPQQVRTLAATGLASLEQHGFAVTELTVEELPASTLLCLIARPD